MKSTIFNKNIKHLNITVVRDPVGFQKFHGDLLLQG